MQSEYKFFMNPTTRQNLLQMDIASRVGKVGVSVKRIVITMLLIGLAFIVIGFVFAAIFEEGRFDWLIITPLLLGALTFIFIFPTVSKRKKVIAHQSEYAIRFKERHGSVEKAVTEIKEFLKNEDNIAYSVSFDDSSFHIIGDWFLDALNYELVHTSEIVAIAGIMGKGTFLILDNGKAQDVMFGPNTWGDVFRLFQNSNPHILYTTDKVTLQGGNIVDVKTAINKKDFAAITNAYLKKKALQERLAPGQN